MVVFSSCRKPNDNNISSNNGNNNPLDSLYFFDSDSGVFDYDFYGVGGDEFECKKYENASLVCLLTRFCSNTFFRVAEHSRTV